MNRNRIRIFSASFAVAMLVAGCHGGQANGGQAGVASPEQVKSEQRAEQRAALEASRKEQASDRALLEEIPPPAKSRYMAIHTRSGWENPYLVVSAKTVSLRIMYPPAPQSNLIPGTLLQPANARKRVLDLRLNDLPEALASLPEQSWPYGRVIALEEDPNEVRADRIATRRNMETAIQALNDLGVVVYEWPGLK
jgi:hypothetical protein